MKKTLLVSVALLATLQLKAQQYSPVAVTGFNQDIIANGTGSATTSTTMAADAVDFALVASDFVSPANLSATPALPANRTINSVVTSGLSFELAPYTGNNDLRLIGTSNGTLTFTTPRAAQEVYVLGFSGSGANNATITVNFTDATTQVFTGQTFKDWFNQTGFAAQGFSRVNRITNAIENLTTNPRMYQIPLVLSAANTSKQIQSVKVTKTSGTGVINVIAVSVKNALTSTGRDAVFANAINISPNPSAGEFMIRTALKGFTMEVTDITGRRLMTQAVNTPEYKLQFEPGAKGMYLLKLSSEGKTAVKKLVVQ